MKAQFLVSSIPENLHRLWEAEDALVAWAKGIIASAPYLIDHLDLIESYMDCVESLRRALPPGDRHIAIGGLFLRQFDSLSHGVRSAVSGNYTGCAMYARDLIETEFLIDYLMDKPGRPEVWLSADQATARNKFGASKVRKELDKRDGYTTEKRKARFEILSAMGSHPTPTALNLKLDGTNTINSGPFKQAQILESCLQELARSVAAGGGRLVKYCSSEIPSGRHISSRLSLALQRTYEMYFSTRSN